MDRQVTISEEMREILNEWIKVHPRYGRIFLALIDEGLCHPMVYLGTNGHVYHNADLDGASIERSHVPKANYADPMFFEHVEKILDVHVIDCNVCQGLLLPTSI